MSRYIIPERLREKQIENENELLGGGFAFPLKITKGGNAKLVEGQTYLKNCVYHFGMYDYLDLVGVPSFGGGLPSLLFGVFSGDNLRYHEDIMQIGLDNWEPRVTEVRVTAGTSTDSDTKVVMVVQYSIEATGEDDYLKVPLEKIGE